MRKFRSIAIILLLFLFAFTVTNGMAQEKGQHTKNSPFLITGKMPHLTRLLMQQWDNPALHLTDSQKTQLLAIRKETIHGVQSLGKQITPLETRVAEGSRAGKIPEELQSLVDSIAKFKAEATMVHLTCIHKTSAVLDKTQLQFLETL